MSQSYLEKRKNIENIQSSIDKKFEDIVETKKQIERLTKHLKLQLFEQQEEVKRLQFKLKNEVDNTYDQSTIKLYVDTSLDHQKTFVCYDVVIIENGEVLTLTGFLDVTFDLSDSSYYETLSLVSIVKWATYHYPNNIIHVYCDNESAVKYLYRTVLKSKSLDVSTKKACVISSIILSFKDHWEKIYPQWISRETPEIRLCDAISKNKLGKETKFNIYCKLLKLSQGKIRNEWTKSSYNILHLMHRQFKRNVKIPFKTVLPGRNNILENP